MMSADTADWPLKLPAIVAASALPPPAAKVRILMALRAIAVAGQIAAIAAALLLGVDLPAAAMALVIAFLLAVQAAAWLRLRRPRAVTDREVGAYLALDLGAYAALLFLSGGATNPFSLLFVLHAALFALLLPPLGALAGLAAVVGAYTLLTRVSLPLELAGGAPLPVELAAFGGWVSLILTATMVAWFVSRNMALLREHHDLLLGAAQKMRNDQTIHRLGALAAGAAHELASPLTTMGVLAENIEREAATPELRRDAAVLTAQVAACRRTLSNLLAAAGHVRAEGGGRQPLGAFLAATVSRFCAMRPDVRVEAGWQAQMPAPEVYADRALQQAILVLLDNAADASPQSVRFAARWDDATLHIAVEDRGPGIAPERTGSLGRVFFTTKPPGAGTGLGLVLAANAVHALDGTLAWRARAEGGTSAQVTLPLQRLRVG